MKKIKIKKILISAFVFVLSIGLVLGQGFYKNTLAKESASLKINLDGKGIKPIVFDVAKEGLPKKLVQPGKISISSGHGVGVVNKGKEPILIQVKAEGFSADVDISSTASSFEKQTGKFLNVVKPGGGVDLSLILDIPRSELNQKAVTSGNIEFTDYKSGKLIAELPIKVINSAVKGIN